MFPAPVPVAPVGPNPLSLAPEELDEEYSEGGGYLYERMPAAFGDRTGWGPLRVAWDTSILVDYGKYGSAFWGDDAFDPEDFDDLRGDANEQYRDELVALDVIMQTWLYRDIRVHVFPYQLDDAKRALTRSDLEMRSRQLDQFDAALDCLGHGTAEPEGSPPAVPGIRPSADRTILEHAVAAGCHILLGRDYRFLTASTRFEAKRYGVTALTPVELVDVMADAGELGVAAAATLPIPDTHKWMHAFAACEYAAAAG